MEIINRKFYICKICGYEYETLEGAIECEKKMISQDKGIKIGDKILITNGDGAGSWAIVKRVFVIDKYWGHYAWNRYWHTIGITVNIIDSIWTRMLTFDNYDIKN